MTQSSAKQRGRTWGLRTRLASHASGRRSGDQFCVYVGDIFVLPELHRSQIEAIRDRTINLDDLIRDFIQNELIFRFAETSSGNRALELERLIKAGVLGQRPDSTLRSAALRASQSAASSLPGPVLTGSGLARVSACVKLSRTM